MNIFGEITAELIPQVAAEIAAAKESGQITLVISSPGGDAFVGLAVYDMLKNSSLKVRTEIIGICASAASTIALAGDERAMGEHSMIMLHPAWVSIAGNASELREQAQVLESITARMVEIAASACCPEALPQIGSMTERELWLSADEAMKAGLATEITKPAAYAASYGAEDMNLKTQFLAFVSGKTEDEIKAFLEPQAALSPEETMKLGELTAQYAVKCKEMDDQYRELDQLRVSMRLLEEKATQEAIEVEEMAKARAEVLAAMKNDGLTIASAESAFSAKTSTEIRAALSAGERMPKAAVIPTGKAPADILAEYQGMADPVKRTAFFAQNSKVITEAQKQR